MSRKGCRTVRLTHLWAIALAARLLFSSRAFIGRLARLRLSSSRGSVTSLRDDQTWQALPEARQR